MENRNETFIVDINRDGTVTIEGRNFTDASCKQLSKQLEDDLGVVTKTTAKPEMARQTTSRSVTKKVVR